MSSLQFLLLFFLRTIYLTYLKSTQKISFVLLTDIGLFFFNLKITVSLSKDAAFFFFLNCHNLIKNLFFFPTFYSGDSGLMFILVIQVVGDKIRCKREEQYLFIYPLFSHHTDFAQSISDFFSNDSSF